MNGIQHSPSYNYSIKQIRNRHKKNSKLIKKRYFGFIKQTKYFCDDVWTIIKEYLIDIKYINSHFYQENTEIKINRYIFCECCGIYNTPFTSVIIGKRYGNLLQIAINRITHVQIKNPVFKMYKTKLWTDTNGEMSEICDDVKTGIYFYDPEYFNNEWNEYTPRPFQQRLQIPSTNKINRLKTANYINTFDY